MQEDRDEGVGRRKTHPDINTRTNTRRRWHRRTDTRTNGHTDTHKKPRPWVELAPKTETRISPRDNE